MGRCFWTHSSCSSRALLATERHIFSHRQWRGLLVDPKKRAHASGKSRRRWKATTSNHKNDDHTESLLSLSSQFLWCIRRQKYSILCVFLPQPPLSQKPNLFQQTLEHAPICQLAIQQVTFHRLVTFTRFF